MPKVALCLAAECGREELVKALYHMGADVNAKMGRVNAYIIALRNDQQKIADWLLSIQPGLGQNIKRNK